MTHGIGLYVHIPFCASRCPYCDFATAPARTTLRVAYLEALREAIAREWRRLGRPRVRTLYGGGGTAPPLSPRQGGLNPGAPRGAFAKRPPDGTGSGTSAALDRARP